MLGSLGGLRPPRRRRFRSGGLLGSVRGGGGGAEWVLARMRCGEGEAGPFRLRCRRGVRRGAELGNPRGRSVAYGRATWRIKSEWDRWRWGTTVSCFTGAGQRISVDAGCLKIKTDVAVDTFPIITGLTSSLNSMHQVIKKSCVYIPNHSSQIQDKHRTVQSSLLVSSRDLLPQLVLASYRYILKRPRLFQLDAIPTPKYQQLKEKGRSPASGRLKKSA